MVRRYQLLNFRCHRCVRHKAQIQENRHVDISILAATRDKYIWTDKPLIFLTDTNFDRYIDWLGVMSA